MSDPIYGELPEHDGKRHLFYMRPGDNIGNPTLHDPVCGSDKAFFQAADLCDVTCDECRRIYYERKRLGCR